MEKVENMIHLTEAARAEVKRLLEKENNPAIGLRVGVKGGGCSGLSYVLDFGPQKENDKVFEESGVRVFVDPKSYLYLSGLTLDYHDGLMDKGFKFINPNASRSCGCGESFSA
jgi:iron-sulfur cluster assembly protein